jgi:tRNA modification GTPase
MFDPADQPDSASSRATPTGPCAGLANDPQSLVSGTTVAAVITPPGRGALATVRVVGTDALRIVAQLCDSDPDGFATRTHNGRLWIGRWNGPGGEPVVVYVGQSDSVEIHSHGGLMPAQTILRDLTASGVLACAWQDLTRRESRTLIEAEAIEALAEAPTMRTAALLLDQLQGALSNRITELRRWLQDGKTADVARELEQLLARAPLGLHLTSPWRVAIVGRPNVGKSSLLNALVGFDRAIVHSAAGTTRDLVTAATAVDGWPVEFCDSAGIRAADEPIESAGVERARRAIAESDWQLVVFDRSQPITDEDNEILTLCPQPFVIVNKIDLSAAWDPSVLARPSLSASALSRAGVDELLRQLGSALVADPPQPGAAIPFTRRQVQLLHKVRKCLMADDASGCIGSLESLVLGAARRISP